MYSDNFKGGTLINTKSLDRLVDIVDEDRFSTQERGNRIYHDSVPNTVGVYYIKDSWGYLMAVKLNNYGVPYNA